MTDSLAPDLPFDDTKAKRKKKQKRSKGLHGHTWDAHLILAIGALTMLFPFLALHERGCSRLSASVAG
ncbi:hypothetical protein [Dermabacter jinjuensis]|uniref:Uncharacterized protein n=1 Tax=Dermabacter jinjuensis TaxID=1667168 RepID=A0ABN5DP93_9MICO|nr:hypothetical protein [Dermabacter jinjuensis]ATH97138.1 hypothetical protein COP05_08590 [Dermabacter jinjuensis]UEB89303.1 hypothetical protein LK448_07275 [Dermabacter jinjuensis]